jgi:hypothetical protein
VGRLPTAEEDAAIDSLTDQFRANGSLLTSLIEEYVASDAFARRKEPAP